MPVNPKAAQCKLRSHFAREEMNMVLGGQQFQPTIPTAQDSRHHVWRCVRWAVTYLRGA